MDFENFPVLEYTEDNFISLSNSNSGSKFDQKLQCLWEQKMMNDCFRYKLGDLKTKYLPGKYGFVTQLNIKRAVERRKPHFISSITMPFNSENFHFGKISETEVLFSLMPKHWEKINGPKHNVENCNHVLIINVSPIEECHSLLVPSVEKCFPQILTFESLRLTIEVMLLSLDKSFRIGFNSLGAFASINHLHFHLYYLRHKLFLEDVSVSHLIENCYELISYPAPAFAFQIKNADVLNTVRSLMVLIDYLVKEEIPHNVFMTKGCCFDENKDNNDYNVIRIFVWAREAVYGSKYDTCFNAAVCELAGHIIVKEAKEFEPITEEYVSEKLRNACYSTFTSIRSEVKNLYK